MSADLERGYVQFKVDLPSEALSGISGLESGEWVTLTSSHGAKAPSDAVMAARPYVSRGEATS
ncbi:MAG: hypothetical protein R3190_16750 [Thermoanaerobaculia bacterium]|nr:hypothetical protein [Thermoanaerobaculia bacterium]